MASSSVAVSAELVAVSAGLVAVSAGLVDGLVAISAGFEAAGGSCIAAGSKGNTLAFLNPPHMFSGVTAFNHASRKSPQKVSLVITLPGLC